MDQWNREELTASYGCALVEFEEQPVEVQDSGKIRHRFRAIR